MTPNGAVDIPRRTPAARRTAWIAIVTAALATGACQEPAPAPVAGPRVENADLGLALASVPVGFELTSSDTEAIRLTGDTPATTGGSIVITVGPEEDGGINLVAESQARIDRFGELGGTSFGSRELQGPIGTAFTVRGRRPGDSGEVEETWIYAIHPSANRLVTVVHEYPPGDDTEARVMQGIEVLGEIEAAAP